MTNKEARQIEKVRRLPHVQVGDISTPLVTPPTGDETYPVSEQALRDYYAALQRDRPLGERIGRFLRAENRAGRRAKLIKDAVLVFAPWGPQVRTLTDVATHLLQPEPNPDAMLKDMILRALTADGGSFGRIRDEDGNIDRAALLAFALRVAIIGAAVAALEALGVPVLDFLADLFSNPETTE